ncbi:TPA: hypothetical protein ACMDUA_005185 [Vibrio harveyi]
MKKYLVALDSNNKSQNDDFKEYIRTNGFGWWYWIDGFWILTDSKDKLTASDLRTKLNDFYPNVRRLVIELRSDDYSWSGYGPSTESRNMFNWLHENM